MLDAIEVRTYSAYISNLGLIVRVCRLLLLSMMYSCMRKAVVVYIRYKRVQTAR